MQHTDNFMELTPSTMRYWHHLTYSTDTTNHTRLTSPSMQFLHHLSNNANTSNHKRLTPPTIQQWHQLTYSWVLGYSDIAKGFSANECEFESSSSPHFWASQLTYNLAGLNPFTALGTFWERRDRPLVRWLPGRKRSGARKRLTFRPQRWGTIISKATLGHGSDSMWAFPRVMMSYWAKVETKSIRQHWQ